MSTRFAAPFTVLLMLGLVVAGAMPLAHAAASVQSLGCDQNPTPLGGDPVINVSNNVAAGETIVVAVQIIAAPPTATVTGVTDSAGNSYALVVYDNGFSDHYVFAASVTNPLSASQTITVGFPFSNRIEACAIAVAGLLTTASFDLSASSNGQGVSADSGNTATTSQADELVLGTVGWLDPSITASAGSGFTEAIQGQEIIMEYRIVSATGSFNATASLSSFMAIWNAAVTTFKICDGQLNDQDGDGVRICDGDCDDFNAAVFPGAPEVCDGEDNDCNGVIDDGSDIDGDGVTTCAGDCDDADPTVFPGAPEQCDGLDNDCDGQNDEGFDLDGDGVRTCDGDCDDSDSSVFPGAPEVCDGVDTDCNGVVDDGFDIDGDGVTTCVGDCDDADPTIFPGAPEQCDGRDSDCDGLIDGDDPDCACVPTGPIEVGCNDGLDGDCDGLIDGDDPDCVPLVVTLESFTARRTPFGVRLRWSTSSEEGNVGFRILRGRGNVSKSVIVDLQLITPVMVPAQGSALSGAQYEYMDGLVQKTGVVHYFLEDVDTQDRTTRHGPVVVEFGPGRSKPRRPVRGRPQASADAIRD